MSTEYDTLEVEVEEARAPSRKVSALAALVILAGVGAVAFVAGTSGLSLRASVNSRAVPGTTECPAGEFSNYPQGDDCDADCQMNDYPVHGSGNAAWPCQVCPEGTYQEADASSGCIACPAHSDPDNFYLTTCNPHPTTANAGSGIGCERHEHDQQSDCFQMKKSSRLSEAAPSSQTCDIGYFSTGIGGADPVAADGRSPCAICPKDTYQDAAGQNGCKACPAGKHTCDPDGTYFGSGKCTHQEHDQESDCESTGTTQ